MGSTPDERWISLNEACEYLGVNRQTIINWIGKQGFPAVKIGRLWKFKLVEIDQWARRGENNRQTK
jgi:excisionase family DNA binding protein